MGIFDIKLSIFFKISNFYIKFYNEFTNIIDKKFIIKLYFFKKNDHKNN